MSNIIILLCCVAAGLCVGIFLKKRVSAKNLFWRDMLRYIEALQLNVTGKQVEMPIFNEEFCQNASEVFVDALQNGKFTALGAQQTNSVRQFFDGLDTASGAALLLHLQFFQKQFQAEFAASNEEVKKSSLYVKLGLLLGVTIGILFV